MARLLMCISLTACHVADPGEGVPILDVQVESLSCEGGYSTPPDNSCDGEDLLRVAFVDLQEEVADGVWSAGEALHVELDLTTTLDGTESHVNYPRLFAEVSAPFPPRPPELNGAVASFYAILPGDSFPVIHTLVLPQEPVEPVEIVYSVGALNCQGNPGWGPCPNPNPIRLNVGL